MRTKRSYFYKRITKPQPRISWPFGEMDINDYATIYVGPDVSFSNTRQRVQSSLTQLARTTGKEFTAWALDDQRLRVWRLG